MPTLSSPLATAVDDTSAMILVTTDNDTGSVFYVVTVSATAPSAAQIIFGTDENDVPAMQSGGQSVLTFGPNIVALLSSLNPATLYYAYMVQRDSLDVLSGVVFVSFTTTGAVGTEGKTISVRHRIDGILTDLTSCKLSDPSGTYGARRVDTQAVIVADGLDFTHDGTGLYSFDLTGLVSGVEYEAWVERVYAGETTRSRVTWTASLALAEGYYVKRAKTLRTAGTVNFNAAFNLDPDALAADESIVQEVFDQADRFVDGRALVLGVTAAGTPPHYVSTTDPIFDMLSDWASRWARAQGYLLRGTTNDPQATAEGQMAEMKREAELRIDELLLNNVDDEDEPGGFGSVPLTFEPTCLRDEFSA